MAITQGTMNKAYVSAIDFLDQRDIDPSIYDVSNDRAFTDVVKLMDRYKPCDMYTYHNFVDSNTFELGVISGGIATSGNAQVTFQIQTGSGYPRAGDLCRSNNANNVGKVAYVKSVTLASGTATVIVRTVNNVPWYASIADEVAFFSNAMGEGSSNPDSRKFPLTKYFNRIQLFREYDKITDVQKVAAIEVNVGGDYHILPYQLIKKKVSLEAQISGAMIAGVMSTTDFGDANPFLADASGAPVQTTGGLDWYIENYGVSDEAAVLGTVNFGVFDDIVDNALAVKAPMKWMVFCASEAKGVVDKFVKNLGSSSVSSVRMIIDGRTADFEIDQFKYRNAVFDFVWLPILDHPQLAGAVSPDMKGSLYLVPKDQIDTYGNGQQPRLQIRYTGTPFIGSGESSSNGIITEWRIGALSGNRTNNSATLETNWYSAQGLECLGVQHFQKFRVV